MLCIRCPGLTVCAGFLALLVELVADASDLVEIDPEVDFDSRRAVYFRQMRYGLYVRVFTSCLPSNDLNSIFRSVWPCSPV